jgi:hypothetical protein
MFIEKAYKGNNEWWRVGVTTLLTTGIFVVNFIAFLVLPKETIEDSYEIMKQMPKSVSLLFNLIPFLLLLALTRSHRLVRK